MVIRAPSRPEKGVECFNVPTASLGSADDDVCKSSDNFVRSSAVRALLTASTLIIILFTSTASLQSRASTDSSPLTDRVMSLARQIATGGESLRDLENELMSKDVELSWEHQHVEELEEKERLMIESFGKTQVKNTETFNQLSQAVEGTRKAQALMGAQLEKETIENAQLKLQLHKALADLAELRKQGTGEAKLRGAPAEMRSLYHAGDSIEIFDDQDGKPARFPGLVTPVMMPGENGAVKMVYNIHRLDNNAAEFAVTEERFQKYQIYPKGSHAFYNVARGVHIPVTIVDYTYFNGERSGEGNEAHGNYKVTFDKDLTHKVQEVSAIRLYRF
jgi:hypothetical protein